jgi:ribosomal protein S18 acetylase RimI-like enzyme
LKIRLAKINDLFQTLDLLAIVIRHMDENGLEQWPAWYPNKEIIKADITKNQLFVAELDSKIVGMVTLSPEIPNEYNSVQWKIETMNVNSVHRLASHPDYRTHQVAGSLMDYCEKMARSQGYDAIRLDTYSKNLAANAFYTKIGYHYCGRIALKFMPEKYNCYEKAL